MINMNIARILVHATLAAALLTVASASRAQEWPNKPVRWIVPFTPGGAMDVIARALGERLNKSLGQPFVIENKPGAGGNIGADFVAKAAADGHTMMITSIGMATNKHLYPKLSYDPVKDFAPVMLVAIVPNVLVVNNTQPQIKSVADVIAAAKASPGKLSYASAGNGTSIHLAGEVFASMAKVNMVHIPYKGSGPAVTDLIGGHVNYMFDSITSAKPHIASGKLRALALTTAKRSTALPNVPTLAEAGLPGYQVSPWFGVFLPAATPKAIIDKLNAALAEALRQPELQAKFETIGAEAIGSSPAALASHLNEELQRWGQMIAERGIKAD
jgi:tripartite-type tricarboxylate transporter receptor subunit TctC